MAKINGMFMACLMACLFFSRRYTNCDPRLRFRLDTRTKTMVVTSIVKLVCNHAFNRQNIREQRESKKITRKGRGEGARVMFRIQDKAIWESLSNSNEY